MLRLLAGIVFLGFSANASAELTPAELLPRIRNQMTDTLARLPNYTCQETIQRKVKRPGAAQFEIADLVRLEVSYVGGRELFAWPGSPRFEEKGIQEFVPAGSIGSGNFGGFARQVFTSGAPVFTWTGQYARNGRTQVDFAFRVAREASTYRLNHDGTLATVAYRGSFSADAETYDVIDLDVEAENIPPQLEFFQARERIEYSRSHLSDSDYLLPKTSETTLYETSGEIDQNHIVFDGCHEYRGESTISFSDPESGPARNVAAAGPKTLPPGIALHLRTLTPIERGVTAIGDTVSAVIEERVQKPAIPAGAKSTMRIVRMQPYQIGNQPGFLIEFQLLSVETGGQKYDAHGSLEGAKGPNASKSDRKGRVAFAGSKPVGAGLRLTWRTTDSR
ncbi:MAG TPA: hypothetical protein VLY24_30965 [Bryobacteraceae bacterium]|nr:hypothetical protein [Bryobacteraceae bacterium]